MEFYGALRDIQFAGNLFVGQIFEEGIEDFLLPAAQFRGAFHFYSPAARIVDNGVDKFRKQRARNPEPAAGHQRQRPRELFASLSVGQQTFGA